MTPTTIGYPKLEKIIRMIQDNQYKRFIQPLGLTEMTTRTIDCSDHQKQEGKDDRSYLTSSYCRDTYDDHL
jgi:hypothetical protein